MSTAHHPPPNRSFVSLTPVHQHNTAQPCQANVAGIPIPPHTPPLIPLLLPLAPPFGYRIPGARRTTCSHADRQTTAYQTTHRVVMVRRRFARVCRTTSSISSTIHTLGENPQLIPPAYRSSASRRRQPSSAANVPPSILNQCSDSIVWCCCWCWWFVWFVWFVRFVSIDSW